MKINLQYIIATLGLFIIPNLIFAQDINFGTAGNFVLFSTDGAVTNTSTTHLTGKVGTNNGSNTGFGNVNGGMHEADGITAQASIDLKLAYNQLADETADFFPSTLLGDGAKLNAGVYAIAGATTLSGNLILDAKNKANAVFIFQIDGSFSTSAHAKVKLINGAQACNIFWKIEGRVDMATGTTMRGTILANNAAINMNSGDTLEGRALSIAGAVSTDGVLAYLPSGCGSEVLTGPDAPSFGEAGYYGFFSADGPVQNSGVSIISGDVGCNVGLTTGFNPLFVSGKIHPIPDGSTEKAAADLLIAYKALKDIDHDIELLYPAQFGGNLVLTPHTYLLSGATTFTDTLYLNSQGVSNAVFVIKIEGALATSSYANVVLINGTKAENVYWLVDGAVAINDYATFNGTIVSQGAIDLFTGAKLNGRALTGVGALATNAITGQADISTSCKTTVGDPKSDNLIAADAIDISIYPNPFSESVAIRVVDVEQVQNFKLHIYNTLGNEVLIQNLNTSSTLINTNNMPSGVYFYHVMRDEQIIKSGKLISQKK